MGKSADAFRTISEVSELLDTPTHVLRFWESKFPQVKPVKRAGGRRYYRPGDVTLLGGIKRLLHEDGMTIRAVQKMLREEGIREVSALSELAVTDETEEAPVPQPATKAEPAPTETVAEAAPPEMPEPAPEAIEPPAPEPTPDPAPVMARESASVMPFPSPAQGSFFDDEPEEIEEVPEEEEVAEARIALDVEPEPEAPAPVVSMTIERKQPAPAQGESASLARLLHNLRNLDPARLSPADRGDLRMLRLRAKALQVRLAQHGQSRAE